MTYQEEVKELYDELPDDLQDFLESADIKNKIAQLEKQYHVELAFLVQLIAVSELTVNDIEEYLIKGFHLDKEVAAELRQKLELQIINPVMNKFFDEGKMTILLLEPKDQKELVLKVFTSDLVPTLDKSPNYLAELNIVVFQTFDADPLVEDTVTNLLYENQEILTNKPFALDGKNQKPTVANWLKDFIKEKGSDMFDAIALSSYLSASNNAKILDPAEKILLTKLLKLYKNLVFFPDSLAGVPTEKWEIFPVDRKAEQFGKTINPLDKFDIAEDTIPVPVAPKTLPAAKAPVITAKPAPVKAPAVITKPAPVPAPKVPVPASTPAAQMAAAPMSTTPPPAMSLQDMEIKKLQDLLKKYPANSLEGRAIASELKRLQTK